MHNYTIYINVRNLYVREADDLHQFFHGFAKSNILGQFQGKFYGSYYEVQKWNFTKFISHFIIITIIIIFNYRNIIKSFEKSLNSIVYPPKRVFSWHLFYDKVLHDFPLQHIYEQILHDLRLQTYAYLWTNFAWFPSSNIFMDKFCLIYPHLQWWWNF